MSANGIRFPFSAVIPSLPGAYEGALRRAETVSPPFSCRP
jgi:hypothetical protein